MCSSTQYLVLGGIAALVAVVVSGSDVAGWIAGITVGAGSYVAARIWPRLRGSGSCALPSVAPPREHAGHKHD